MYFAQFRNEIPIGTLQQLFSPLLIQHNTAAHGWNFDVEEVRKMLQTRNVWERVVERYLCLKNQFYPEMKYCQHCLPRHSKQISVWEINLSCSLPISLQNSLHSTEYKNRYLINITWCTALGSSSSYPSVYGFAGSIRSAFVKIHSLHCFIIISCCVSRVLQ